LFCSVSFERQQWFLISLSKVVERTQHTDTTRYIPVTTPLKSNVAPPSCGVVNVCYLLAIAAFRSVTRKKVSCVPPALLTRSTGRVHTPQPIIAARTTSSQPPSTFWLPGKVEVVEQKRSSIPLSSPPDGEQGGHFH